MATKLSKFTDAYAMLTIAVYEPLILRWRSRRAIRTLADTIVRNAHKKVDTRRVPEIVREHMATGEIMELERRLSAMIKKEQKKRKKNPFDEILDEQDEKPPLPPTPVDQFDKPIQAYRVRPLPTEDFPNAVYIDGDIYPTGVVDVIHSLDEERTVEAQTMPIVTKSYPTMLDPEFDVLSFQEQLYFNMIEAAENYPQPEEFRTQIQRAMSSLPGDYTTEAFLPSGNIDEKLSPIGIAHFYRQLYFNEAEGYGPIEHAFTVAPKETLEIFVETVRRQVHEEVEEVGSEIFTERAEELKQTDEVSEKVSSMLERNVDLGVSLTSTGGTPVFQVSAKASANMKSSKKRGREFAAKRLKDTTRRASERITRTYRLTTKMKEEFTETSQTRRVIENTGDKPVNYGLRRVLRSVKVKVQDLGPRLVLQEHINDPGIGLRDSQFIHFSDSEHIAPPGDPPELPPRPKGGNDTGRTTTTINVKRSSITYVSITILAGKDRKITSVTIDSITAMGELKKGKEQPSARNDRFFATHQKEGRYNCEIGVSGGHVGLAVAVSYSYTWEPTSEVQKEWEDARRALAKKRDDKENAEAYVEAFEQKKALITEKSKIRPRPANDLRREERYEIMNRMISHYFERVEGFSAPTPLQIETFRQYFDIEAMFYYTHPSWWKPRQVVKGSYEITSESEPAPMGSSLGWKIHLDGDTRRNAFLNSPWVRICLPIHPGREREAFEWLANHVVGKTGYNLVDGPLKELLDAVETLRKQELELGIKGPEYVKADTMVVDSLGTPPSGPLQPQHLYPVIDEFNVVVPTEGFIYDEIETI